VQTSEFEGWSQLLNTVVGGGKLTVNQSSSVMGEILEGRATSAQLAALLSVLRSRGETVDEMTGFADAMLNAAVGVPLSDEVRERAIDTCGTGGDRSNTINISTTAAFVVAAAGVPVCKHGNRAASSQSGTADVLEVLGANLDPGPAGVARCIEKVGVGFCLAPAYHPAVRHAVPTRKELGIPTAFNFLGPLANPGRVKRQVIGVSDSRKAEVVLKVLVREGATRAMVVYGADGLDEITTTSTSTIHELRDGETQTYEFDPSEFGVAAAELSDLVGGEPQHNADRLEAILAGEQGPQSDIVAVNAAAALIVGGAADDFASGIELAQAILTNGKGLKVLHDFVAESNA
jgi:anthranilate phosphoribosyltransferase